MEINAVGNFPARFLGSWSRWHLSPPRLAISHCISRLSTYLKTRQVLETFTQLLLCRGIVKSLP